MENDYQPVRIAPSSNVAFHSKKGSLHSEWERMQGKIIRVRPTSAVPPIARERGCDSKQFFEIHPEDRRLLRPGVGTLFCEHQILAD